MSPGSWNPVSWEPEPTLSPLVQRPHAAVAQLLSGQLMDYDIWLWLPWLWRSWRHWQWRLMADDCLPSSIVVHVPLENAKVSVIFIAIVICIATVLAAVHIVGSTVLSVLLSLIMSLVLLIWFRKLCIMAIMWPVFFGAHGCHRGPNA